MTNPTRDRVGAVGVFFGNGDSRNVGTPLEPSEAQTNQRAELKAIFVALQTLSEVGPSSLTNSSNPVPVSHSPLDLLIPHRQKSGDAKTKGDVVVVSDSQYSIDCVTKWCHNWARNNWVKADGVSPVKHSDLIRAILAEMRSLAESGRPVSFTHVRSHTGAKDVFSLGNAAADKLATTAARATFAGKKNGNGSGANTTTAAAAAFAAVPAGTVTQVTADAVAKPGAVSSSSSSSSSAAAALNLNVGELADVAVGAPPLVDIDFRDPNGSDSLQAAISVIEGGGGSRDGKQTDSEQADGLRFLDRYDESGNDPVAIAVEQRARGASRGSRRTRGEKKTCNSEGRQHSIAPLAQGALTGGRRRGKMTSPVER